MKINIHAKGFHIKEDETQYVNQKMEKITNLAKRLKDESSEIKVEIDKNDTKKKEETITCIITLFIPHSTIRGVAKGMLVKETVDLAKQKLIPQIEEYKAKLG